MQMVYQHHEHTWKVTLDQNIHTQIQLLKWSSRADEQVPDAFLPLEDQVAAVSEILRHYVVDEVFSPCQESPSVLLQKETQIET